MLHVLYGSKGLLGQQRAIQSYCFASVALIFASLDGTEMIVPVVCYVPVCYGDNYSSSLDQIALL